MLLSLDVYPPSLPYATDKVYIKRRPKPRYAHQTQNPLTSLHITYNFALGVVSRSISAYISSIIPRYFFAVCGRLSLSLQSICQHPFPHLHIRQGLMGNLRRSKQLILNSERLKLQPHRTNMLIAIELRLSADFTQLLHHRFPHLRLLRRGL